MNIYNINDINENIFKKHILFKEPVLNKEHYLITCEKELFIQIDDITIKNNFSKENNKIFINIYIKSDLEKHILTCDNLIINITTDMFPLWFDKEIDMEDLLEYYTPTALDAYGNYDNYDSYDEMYETNETISDVFSSDLSENIKNDEVNKEDTKNKDSAIFINCEVPYSYEENDLDIMIFDESNNIIEDLWNNINIMGKTGKCVIKFSGLKIEKDKFNSIWELIQLKIY
jgi:hypothetical protein